jgi:hypothetical protein
MNSDKNDQQDVIETTADETEVDTEVETEEVETEETAVSEEETEEGDDKKPETEAEKDKRIAELEIKNKKLYARLQRDKGKSAGTKDKTKDKPEALSREEVILFAQGLSEEEVEQASKVAALQGVKLTEAVKDDLFTGWKAKRDKQVELQKAQLGGSKGAKASVKKTFDSPGLSDDDHRALFKESQ